MDLDDLLDPVRLAALWSARPDAAASGPAATPGLPATPVLSVVTPVDHAAHAAGSTARAIDVHAQLRALLCAVEHELGAHFDPSSPPRRALDVHLELLRARLTAAWPADAVPAPEARAAALVGALPLIDQIEDLLEALLRAGPWNASATGGTR